MQPIQDSVLVSLDECIGLMSYVIIIFFKQTQSNDILPFGRQISISLHLSWDPSKQIMSPYQQVTRCTGATGRIIVTGIVLIPPGKIASSGVVSTRLVRGILKYDGSSRGYCVFTVALTVFPLSLQTFTTTLKRQLWVWKMAIYSKRHVEFTFALLGGEFGIEIWDGCSILSLDLNRPVQSALPQLAQPRPWGWATHRVHWVCQCEVESYARHCQSFCQTIDNGNPPRKGFNINNAKGSLPWTCEVLAICEADLNYAVETSSLVSKA
jgi:hypothetical protein